ncbi:MAG: PAS domain S-box protein [Methylococcus sp.]
MNSPSGQNNPSVSQFLGSEESYRLMVDSVIDYAIIMIDKEGKVASWNAGAERLKGYRPEDIIGQHFSRFYTPEAIAAGLPDKELRMASEGGRFEDEGWRLRQDGTRFWANVIITALRDKTGVIRGFSKVTRDLTERNQTAEALKKASTYTRSMIEASLDPLVTISPEGKITDVNGATEKVTGCLREQLVGTDFSGYFTAPDKAREGYEKVFRDGQVRDYPLEICRRDGKGVPVLYNASVYRDEQGEVIGVFAAARDITEMKRAEERIRQQSREILELSTPVMQVWQGVVAVPLIGTLDSQRTQLFMERLLERIVETNSPVALVDIMGVPTIDTQTAQHLIETITAVRLLGAQVVLTGVRPAIAQTLVHLGVDLSGIITRSSLAAGLVVALDMLKLKVITTADQR